MSTPIRFLLNDQEILTIEPPGLLVLDFLRHRMRLMGTKEGCKEGDCGACTVLVGELQGDHVHYRPVTSCLMPVAELHGKHLVTVEGLNLEHLSAVQEAIVEEGATQCGFCTPGIVVSLTGQLLRKGPAMTAEDIKYALSGHLCRCTGYNSLKRAGQRICRLAAQLQPNGKQNGDYIDQLIRMGQLPPHFREAPEKLRRIPPPRPARRKSEETPPIFVAGGTDIYVQRGQEIPHLPVEVLNLHPEMRGITRRKGKIHLGALTTFEEFADHPLIRRLIPEMPDFMRLNASWQIRNRATLGGNIINASPIGDMTIFLLAQDAVLVLKEGRRRRTVPMREFYLGYKTLAKEPQEVLAEIIFPEPTSATRINFEKVSKRKYLDIASVNSAIRIVAPDGVIEEVHLSLGGVAPVPLYLRETVAFLTGQPLTPETIRRALSLVQEEISPISDIRGSAEYKRLLARQLVLAHFVKLFPERISVEEVIS